MENYVRLATDVEFDSIVNGPGIRAVIWFQGCYHNCPMCHNPQTHAINGGKLYDIDEICDKILKDQLIDGVCISGGEPFLQPEKLLKILKKLNGINVWCYTGFLYETLLNDEKTKEILPLIDVLIDGKFEIDKFDYRLKYKGSSNQRIIDVKKSLEKNKLILYNI